MQDVKGQTISIGDEVAFVDSSCGISIYTGVVTRFAGKKVYVESTDFDGGLSGLRFASKILVLRNSHAIPAQSN